jgi:hypothetical protein
MSTAATSPQPPPLRRLPVPISQPRPALKVIRDEPDGVSPAQGALTLALPVPASPRDGSLRDGAVGDVPSDRRFSSHQMAPLDDFAARRRTSGTFLPEPKQWATQFVQAAVEVAAGLRPANQLIRWTSDEVHGRLARRAELGRQAVLRGRPPQRSVVRSTRVCIPRDGVAEATVIVTDGSRTRAVALRLEGLDGRWRVTALEVG